MGRPGGVLSAASWQVAPACEAANGGQLSTHVRLQEAIIMLRVVVAGLASGASRRQDGISWEEKVDKLGNLGVDIVLLRHPLCTRPPHLFES